MSFARVRVCLLRPSPDRSTALRPSEHARCRTPIAGCVPASAAPDDFDTAANPPLADHALAVRRSGAARGSAASSRCHTQFAALSPATRRKCFVSFVTKV